MEKVFGGIAHTHLADVDNRPPMTGLHVAMGILCWGKEKPTVIRCSEARYKKFLFVIKLQQQIPWDDVHKDGKSGIVFNGARLCADEGIQDATIFLSNENFPEDRRFNGWYSASTEG